MKFYTAGQVAEMVGVTKRTVDRWRSQGIFVPKQRTPGGHSRYTQEQIDRLLNPNVKTKVKVKKPVSTNFDDLMG